MIPLVACSADRVTTLDQSHVEKIAKHPNVIITAPKELIGGTLTIDESETQRLWPDTLIEGRRWTFWRRVFRFSDDPAPSAAKAYLELTPGKHALSIMHDRYKEIVKTIEFRDEQQQLRIDTDEVIQKSDDAEERDAHGSASGSQLCGGLECESRLHR